VASFSFGAGNAGKLLRVPLYIAGRLATLVIPRTRDLWVFGSAAGLSDGGWALYRHAAQRGERAVWLTGGDREAADARAHGIPAADKHSLRGFWLTARAAVTVVTHGFGDVNRYAATGGVIVQLWHGIPLKRIGVDAAVTTASPVRFGGALVGRALAVLYRGTQGRIRVLPAASELVRGRLESAFGLTSARVPVTGEPRVDVLSQGTAERRREAAVRELGELLGDRHGDLRDAPRVLYAPTWRDGAADPAAPDAAEIALLRALLDETGAVLLIRSHPLGGGDYAAALGARVRLLTSDLVTDVTPLLPGMDVLITDYSSLAFDAALVPLPTVFFAPDLDAYARSRGFYGTYRDVAGDDVPTTWGQVAGRVRALLDDPAAHAAGVDAARALSARVHAFDDGLNTDRVYRAIRRCQPVPRHEGTS